MISWNRFVDEFLSLSRLRMRKSTQNEDVSSDFLSGQEDLIGSDGI